MRGLYFDCASGISGNMTLGALLEIVGDTQYLIDELSKLNVEGYRVEVSKKIKNGITGTYVDVILESEEHMQEHVHEDIAHTHEHTHENMAHIQEHAHEEMAHMHEHGHTPGETPHTHEGMPHAHVHRNLRDVYAVIDGSSLGEDVKELAKRIFARVARAESKVHGKPLEEVHFHEVGALDSIVDIVGTAILIRKIAPDRILSSVVNDGHGFIPCAHGVMSVPVPATSEIFAEGGVKFRQIDEDTELVTPTGAAIIAELAEDFVMMPPMRAEKIGWGAGSRNLKISNMLKVYYGEMDR